MSLLKYKYATSDTIIYQTNLYSGSDPDITSTEQFTLGIDHSADMWTNITFKVQANNAIDEIELLLYKALTGTFDGDEKRILRLTTTVSAAEKIYSFMLTPSHGPGHYRFGMDGTASTGGDIEVKYRQAHLETT